MPRANISSILAVLLAKQEKARVFITNKCIILLLLVEQEKARVFIAYTCLYLPSKNKLKC